MGRRLSGAANWSACQSSARGTAMTACAVTSSCCEKKTKNKKPKKTKKTKQKVNFCLVCCRHFRTLRFSLFFLPLPPPPPACAA
jgi:hypothetical protein